MGRPVIHFEIIGTDGLKLHKFYSEMFGWTTEPMGDTSMDYATVPRYEAVTPEGETAGIAGGIGSAPDGEAGWVTVYVEVDDVEASLARAEALGGQRTHGPVEVMEGFFIGHFKDPQGNLIGLAHSAGS